MTRESPFISVVIAGYNAAGYISACIQSVYNQSYKRFELIFIDNGSTDETASILDSYPHMRVIKNNENLGFSLANNQGIKSARGDYILTLNSDVVLDRDFLLEIIRDIGEDRAGMFGAKILTADGRRIDSTGLVMSKLYRFFDRGRGEMDTAGYDNARDIFGPCAAAALYKKEMLEDIRYNGEYFDEDFFFLAEDFDIAWRARQRHWEAKFISSAVCYHARNSTNFDKGFRQYLSFRNRYFLLLKNLNPDTRYILAFLLYDIPRLVYMLFTNKYTLKALYEMARFSPAMLRKRGRK